MLLYTIIFDQSKVASLSLKSILHSARWNTTLGLSLQIYFCHSLPFLSVLCMCAKLLQSCPTLCNPTDYSPPGSSVPRILQERILSEMPCPPPGDLSDSGIEPETFTSPALASRFFTPSASSIAQS